MAGLIVLKHIILDSLVKFFLGFNSKLKMGDNVVFQAKPLVEIKNNSIVEIGAKTVINSRNRGYHINMHSPCKLLADGKNAIIKIGKNCRIHGTCIHAKLNITIGDNCLIAANTHIVDSNGHLLSMDAPELRLTHKDEPKEVIIHNNVWIGANCIILPGTVIGEGAVISAGSVVRGVVSPKSIYAGNPAVLVKQY
jgi:Acetyltransferase (isoleucine patch superfamily)